MRNFNHTVNVLVKAYFDGNLKHGDCHKCAVGNIVGSNNWALLFCTCDSTWKQHFNPSWNNNYTDQLKLRQRRYMGVIEIEQSGYSKMELARVEHAFEVAPKGNSEDEWMFNGLMAVVDVLADIHGINLEAKESAKLLFVKL